MNNPLNTELEKLLKEHSEEHFNSEDVDDSFNYQVSMGALALDTNTDGGLGPGMHRFFGPYESGKTSCCLEIVKNFLNTVPNSRALFVKAEGRLSENVKKRSGLEFVLDLNDWRSSEDGSLGNVLILKSNIYELVADFVGKTIRKSNNPNNIKYIIVIDSLDGLVLREDWEKVEKEGFDTNAKVAGAPLLTKRLFRQYGLPITERGHMVLMTSQVSTKIEASQYAPKDNRKVAGTGGNAAMHYADWAFEFKSKFNKDNILEKPNQRPGKDNAILGHWSNCVIQKSTNEKTQFELRYPIKYGQLEGTSIWRGLEVVDELIAWDLLIKNGAWFKFSDFALAKMEESQLSFEVEKQYQGMKSLYDLFDKSTDLTNFWYKYICDNMVATL